MLLGLRLSFESCNAVQYLVITIIIYYLFKKNEGFAFYYHSRLNNNNKMMVMIQRNKVLYSSSMIAIITIVVLFALASLAITTTEARLQGSGGDGSSNRIVSKLSLTEKEKENDDLQQHAKFLKLMIITKHLRET